ncbi:MAG: hypothetical protein AAFZ65_20345, partial [Planctomycetota bacterium]
VSLIAALVGTVLALIPFFFGGGDRSSSQGVIVIPAATEPGGDLGVDGGATAGSEVRFELPTTPIVDRLSSNGLMTNIGMVFVLTLIGLSFDHVRRRHHFEAEVIRQWGPAISAISRLDPIEAQALERIVQALTRIPPGDSDSEQAVRELARLDLKAIADSVASAPDGGITAHVSLATTQLNRRFCVLYDAAIGEHGSWYTISCLAFWSDTNLSCTHEFFRRSVAGVNGERPPKGTRFLVLRNGDPDELEDWERDVLEKILSAARNAQQKGLESSLQILAPKDPDATPARSLGLENCALLNGKIAVLMNYPGSEFSSSEQLFKSMSVRYSGDDVQRVREMIGRVELLVGENGPLEDVTQRLISGS